MQVNVKKECTEPAEICKCMGKSSFVGLVWTLNWYHVIKNLVAQVHWHLEGQAYKAYLQSANFNNGMFLAGT